MKCIALLAHASVLASRENGFPERVSPRLCGSGVVSIDQVDARVLRVRRAFRRSRHAIAAARDDLESHQLWLDRHRAAWAEHVKHYERRLGSKRGIWAVKRLALRLFLVFPLVCVALFRLVARFVPHLRGSRLGSSLPLPALASLIQKRVWSLLSSWPSATRRNNTPSHRIPGLDGQLCIGQPMSSNVTPKLEPGLLQARLVVASVGAVIVGFLAAATTPDRHGERAEVPLRVGADRPAPLPSGIANALRDEGSAPNSVPGFAVQAQTPAEELVSLPGATIGDMMSITRPLVRADEQPDATIELLEVTPPLRKPTIKIKRKRKPPNQKGQLTLWDQLPWLR